MYHSLKFLNSNIGFKIFIVSPLNIIKWSWRKINNNIISGLISEPYTVTFSTGIPKINGLFCEKIFGPLISWQCKCGLFNNIKPIKYTYLCPICGFENTTNRIRRYRIGYIYLYSPIAHIWYIYSLIPYILNMSIDTLLFLLYYKFIYKDITKKTFFNIDYMERITTSQLIFASHYIQFLLKQLNLLDEILKIKSLLLTNIKHSKKKYYLKIFHLLNLCIINNIQPYWVMLDILPVLPAGLRPLIQLGVNKFVSSSLNEFYRIIIIKNNRLKRWQILRQNLPIFFEIIEKYNLQKTIDQLIDSKKKNITSLSSHLQGKYNYFRQHILGKRVDFSGRSVIVSGPSLTFNKIGLPINLALEFFKPIIYNILKNNVYLYNLLQASYYIEYSPMILKRLLKFILMKEVILLNRAPTLHKVNIQSFKPYLIENEAIKLLPLACSGFNADFDGDQMGIFLILSSCAKKEAKKNIMFDKNLFSSSIQKNIFKYSQAIILGLNTLLSLKGNVINNLFFTNIEDALSTYNHSLIQINTIFLLKVNLNSYFNFKMHKKYILTSIGRLLLQKLI